MDSIAENVSIWWRHHYNSYPEISIVLWRGPNVSVDNFIAGLSMYRSVLHYELQV